MKQTINLPAAILGRVACCETVEQLRRYKTAITVEGMLYQGYVARRIQRRLMEDVFIGRRAVNLRIARLKEELGQLEEEIKHWVPINQILAQKHDPLFSQYFVQATVKQRQADYLRGLEIAKEVSDIDDQISHLDLLWLDEQRGIIAELGKEIVALNKEKDQKIVRKGELKERIRQLEYEVLPEHYQKLTNIDDRLREEFSAEYQEKIGRLRSCLA